MYVYVQVLGAPELSKITGTRTTGCCSIPEPRVHALDSATIEDEDDAGGIYDADDLEVIP
jgi:hypothetical protein